jgi:translocator protein
MTRADTPADGLPPTVLALLAAAPEFVALTLGNMATLPNIPYWYAFLDKPRFNPPNWVFAPVWTALYCLMGYAFYRILRLPAGSARNGAITIFLVQIALNIGWSFAFFGAHNPALGFAVVVALEGAILLCVARFAQIDRVAALCLYPYAAWVAFAAVLNAAIWMLNQ